MRRALPEFADQAGNTSTQGWGVTACVLSTPSMIALMERASIQAVQDYLPEGHTTVGFEVHVKHFKGTPKSKKVTVRAELIEVDARKLRFKVDEDKKVGDGTHRRAIIAIQRQGCSVSTAIINFAMPIAMSCTRTSWSPRRSRSALLCFDHDNSSVTIGCDLNRPDAPFRDPNGNLETHSGGTPQ